MKPLQRRKVIVHLPEKIRQRDQNNQSHRNHEPATRKNAALCRRRQRNRHRILERIAMESLFSNASPALKPNTIHQLRISVSEEGFTMRIRKPTRRASRTPDQKSSSTCIHRYRDETPPAITPNIASPAALRPPPNAQQSSPVRNTLAAPAKPEISRRVHIVSCPKKASRSHEPAAQSAAAG